MAASDYFPDLPDIGDVLESEFRQRGWSYNKIEEKGITRVKNVNFGPDRDPGSPYFDKDMIFTDTEYIPLQHSTNHRGKFKTGNMTKETKKEEVTLPDDIIEVSNTQWSRDLVIISIPKMGKGTILGDLTKKKNGLVLDLEKGGYEFISARKMSTYNTQETNRWEAFQNFVKYRKALLEQKGKYEFLIIDGLTDLDDLSEIGGTLAYQNTVIGKKFNRDAKGDIIPFGDPEWRSVLTLPEGAGYAHTRAWFLQQFEFFRQISPYRIYAAHVADKYIKDNGKEEVVGSEIALTGKLKTIFASKVTALAKLTADGDERYLNFDVLNDSIIAGSRAPHLKGKILISKMEKDGKVKTFWENIYK